MSPSVMRGRELVTRHYDGEGNLTGWSVRDGEWTDEDMAEATALAVIEADTCPECKQRRSRSKHPMMAGEYRVRFLGECNSCAEWDDWRASHKDEPNSRQYDLVERDGAPPQDTLEPIDWDDLDSPPPVPPRVRDSDALAGSVGVDEALAAAFADDTPHVPVPPG